MAEPRKAKTDAKAPKEPKATAPKEPKAAKPAATEQHKARIQPKLETGTKVALGLRAQKKAVAPRFRRHEWWRYKKLGGKHASWRVPRGIHSKTRRHLGYRPPLVSLGYRGPESVRGLHPSGFEEVLVHNEADLAKLDKATQAARIGGTVGGRKQKLIVAAADKAGIHVLNRGSN